MWQSWYPCACGSRREEEHGQKPPAESLQPQSRALSEQKKHQAAAKLASLHQVCANCDFPGAYDLAESGYFSREVQKTHA